MQAVCSGKAVRRIRKLFCRVHKRSVLRRTALTRAGHPVRGIVRERPGHDARRRCVAVVDPDRRLLRPAVRGALQRVARRRIFGIRRHDVGRSLTDPDRIPSSVVVPLGVADRRHPVIARQIPVGPRGPLRCRCRRRARTA